MNNQPKPQGDLPLQTKRQREARAARIAKLYPTRQAKHAAKAQRVAKKYLHNQAAFDRIMAQFSPEMRPHVLKRLLPHLPFEPSETGKT